MFKKYDKLTIIYDILSLALHVQHADAIDSFNIM